MLCRNGVYARSIVRGLQSVGIATTIVSGHSDALPMTDQDAEGLRLGAAPHVMFGVPVPAAKWRCLHTGCGWSEFAAAGDDEALTRSVAASGCAVAFAVDWHAVEYMTHLQQTARRLASAAEPTASAQLAALAALPVVFLNFRVYATSVGLHTNILTREALVDACSSADDGGGVEPVSSDTVVKIAASDADVAACESTDAAFFRCKEGAAVRNCAMTVALCRQDAVASFALAACVDPLTGRSFDQRCGVLLGVEAPPNKPATPDIRVLLPPLRSDIAAALAGEASRTPAAGATPSSDAAATGSADGAPAARRFLSCMVRISPEKGPLRFAQACAQPELQVALKETGIVPLLCGAVGDAGECGAASWPMTPRHRNKHCPGLRASCARIWRATHRCRIRACDEGYAQIGVRGGRHRVPLDRVLYGPTRDAGGPPAERSVCAPCR